MFSPCNFLTLLGYGSFSFPKQIKHKLQLGANSAAFGVKNVCYQELCQPKFKDILSFLINCPREHACTKDVQLMGEIAQPAMLVNSVSYTQLPLMLVSYIKGFSGTT